MTTRIKFVGQKGIAKAAQESIYLARAQFEEQQALLAATGMYTAPLGAPHRPVGALSAALQGYAAGRALRESQPMRTACRNCGAPWEPRCSYCGTHT